MSLSPDSEYIPVLSMNSSLEALHNDHRNSSQIFSVSDSDFSDARVENNFLKQTSLEYEANKPTLMMSAFLEAQTMSHKNGQETSNKFNILKYCQAVRKDKYNNYQYQCNSCGFIFTGYCKVYSHMLCKTVGKQRVKPCKNAPISAVEEINALLMQREYANTAVSEREGSEEKYSTALKKRPRYHNKNSEADECILSFVLEYNLNPVIVKENPFLEMIKAIKNTDKYYIPTLPELSNQSTTQ